MKIKTKALLKIRQVILVLFLAIGCKTVSANIIYVDVNAVPQQQWSKTFGGTGSDIAYSVKQTTDGGYILAGLTSSFGAGSDDLWLVKTDPNGNKQWNKTFGGPAND
jgi:hypothetical protein